MANFIFYGILWTLALYGLLEIIKTILYICTYTNLKSDGTYLIVAVKNQENKIEFFMRSLLFRFLYGNEDYLKNIIIADLNSTDNTKKILNHLEKDYDCIKVVNWKECKDIIDNVNIFSNEKVIYGKYLANNNYTSKENSSVDYVFLLSMILNYVLSFNCNEINPIEFMLDNIKLNDITLDLLKRTTKCDFILTKKDIDALFNTSFQRIYHHENEIYVDEFKRKRKLTNKL